jgi:hypothetical protein
MLVRESTDSTSTDPIKENHVSAQQPAAYPSNNSSGSDGLRGAPPKRVNIAFWLYIAAAALSLISLIISLTTVDASRSALEQQLERQGTTVDQATLDAAIGATITASVVFGLLYLAAYVLFAFFMRRGANWARIVLLVITALSLLDVLSGFGVGAVRVLLGVIATVLIFTGDAGPYFRGAKARKAGA